MQGAFSQLIRITFSQLFPFPRPSYCLCCTDVFTSQSVNLCNWVLVSACTVNSTNTKNLICTPHNSQHTHTHQRFTAIVQVNLRLHALADGNQRIQLALIVLPAIFLCSLCRCSCSCVIYHFSARSNTGQIWLFQDRIDCSLEEISQESRSAPVSVLTHRSRSYSLQVLVSWPQLK